MDYEQAKERLITLMEANDGNLTAGLVEQDSELAANRELVSAAARELASEPDVIVRRGNRRAGLVSLRLPHTPMTTTESEDSQRQ
jgi:hypothetical protein